MNDKKQSDIFDFFRENDVDKSSLLDFVKSVRDIIVAKQDPYFTIVKNQIEQIAAETLKTASKDYQAEMGKRLSLLQSKSSSEYHQNLMSIFMEMVLANHKVLSKETLKFLNDVWKEKR